MHRLDLRKLQSVCRICLREYTTESVTIFTLESAGTTVADKLRLCTGVILRREEFLPQRVCRACLDELEAASGFRVKCLASNETLREYVPNVACNGNESAVHEAGPIKKEEIVVKEEPEFVADFLEECLQDDSTAVAEPAGPLDEVASSQRAGNEHSCPECGKRLKTKTSLEKHVVTMHERRQRAGRVSGHGESRRYHCAECEYATRHSQSLVYHMRRHTGERPHRCECGAAFTQPSALAAHRRTHSDLTFHTCATCGKQFKYKESYERHQLVHTESKLSCIECGKALKTQKSLAAHMNRHLGLRNFSCEWCGATFVTDTELINHRRKHDAAQRDRFQCHLCSYKTYAKKSLIVHLKRHTGERLFKCSLCWYDGYTRGELITHQRSHTKEKRYPCPGCGQRFVHSSSLNKHVRRAHGEKFVWNDTVDRKLVATLA